MLRVEQSTLRGWGRGGGGEGGGEGGGGEDEKRVGYTKILAIHYFAVLTSPQVKKGGGRYNFHEIKHSSDHIRGKQVRKGTGGGGEGG